MAKSSSGQNGPLFAFGPPPLFAGENEQAYGELYARYRELVEPGDFIEEMFLRDFVDLDWDVLRLRRLKADLCTLAIERGKHFPSLLPRTDASDELGEHAVSKLAIAEYLEPQLEKLGLIERLIASAEARRNALLREIERHRLGFGRSLRKAVGMLEAPPVQSA